MENNENIENVESSTNVENNENIENPTNVELEQNIEIPINEQIEKVKEPSEVDVLKNRIEQLENELLQTKYKGLDQEDIDFINNSNFNNEGKEYLLKMVNHYKSANKTSGKSLEATIEIDNSYENQFDENGNVIVKSLDELL